MQVGVLDDDEQVCQMEGCAEIDLLPAKCSNCGKTFCSRHISGTAHNCQGKRDAVVATCPVCQRVVSLEYDGQEVNEAVSRHMDRGCRDASLSAPSHAPPPGASFLSRAIHMLGVNSFPSSSASTVNDKPSTRSGGVLLGSATSSNTRSSKSSCLSRLCAVPGCTFAMGVRVQCDQCGKHFCINHRSPAQHNCSQQLAKPRVSTQEPSTSSVSADSASASASRVTSITSAATSHRSKSTSSSTSSAAVTTTKALLAAPRNTCATASGKKTELAADMVTSLVSILFTREANEAVNTNPSGALLDPAVVFIPPFYMHINKNFSLGRVVDLALDDAMSNKEGASDVRLYRQQRWYVFIVPIPVVKDAKSEMYPPQSLSTVVSKTPLAAAASSVIFISKNDTLRPDALSAVRAVQKKLF